MKSHFKVSNFLEFIKEYQSATAPIQGTEDSTQYNYIYIISELGYYNKYDKVKASLMDFEKSTDSLPKNDKVYIEEYKKYMKKKKINEDMGAVVTSTPSAIPGQTIGGNTVGSSFGDGGIVGSGDISATFSKPNFKLNKKRDKKRKSKKFSNLISFSDFKNKKK